MTICIYVMEIGEDGESDHSHIQNVHPFKIEVNDVLCWLRKGETFKGQSFQYAVTYCLFIYAVYLYYHGNSTLITSAGLCFASIEIV